MTVFPHAKNSHVPTERRAPLLVASDGHPRLAATWSGTPLRVVEALEALGVRVDGVDHGETRKTRRWLDKLNFKRLYPECEFDADVYRRIGAARSRRIARVRAAVERSGTRAVLHMGTEALPWPNDAPHVRHYLLVDSTWDLWSGNPHNRRMTSERYREAVMALERRAFSQAQHVFTLSEYVRDNLVLHFGLRPERLTVVGSGRGVIQPTKGRAADGGYILMVARQRFEDKGGLLLLRAFELARRRDPSLRLKIVGDEKSKLLAQGMTGVEFVGFVPREELQAIFENAALYAMPALYEPWGLVYLEALSCGVPLLGLNRGALPEFTRRGEFGFLVDEAQPEAVADALIDAFSDRARLRNMGEAGRRHCLDTYSWENVARRIADVLRRDELEAHGADVERPSA